MTNFRITVKFTANFEASLDAVQAFLLTQESPHSFDRLLDDLADTVIPNLERFPGMGRPFASRRPDSVEAVSLQEKLLGALADLDPNGDIREYLIGDYLLLYAHIAHAVYLLSIRHHRQLSFELSHLWTDQG